MKPYQALVIATVLSCSVSVANAQGADASDANAIDNSGVYQHLNSGSKLDYNDCPELFTQCGHGKSAMKSSSTATTDGSTASKVKKPFLKKLKNDFVRTAERVRFPSSDDSLSGNVDASLSGASPVNAHETKSPSHQTPHVVPQSGHTETQPPVVLEPSTTVTQ